MKTTLYGGHAHAVAISNLFSQVARLHAVSDVLYNCTAKVRNASFYRKRFVSTVNMETILGTLLDPSCPVKFHCFVYFAVLGPWVSFFLQVHFQYRCTGIRHSAYKAGFQEYGVFYLPCSASSALQYQLHPEQMKLDAPAREGYAVIISLQPYFYL